MRKFLSKSIYVVMVGVGYLLSGIGLSHVADEVADASGYGGRAIVGVIAAYGVAMVSLGIVHAYLERDEAILRQVRAVGRIAFGLLALVVIGVGRAFCVRGLLVAVLAFAAWSASGFVGTYQDAYVWDVLDTVRVLGTVVILTVLAFAAGWESRQAGARQMRREAEEAEQRYQDALGANRTLLARLRAHTHANDTDKPDRPPADVPLEHAELLAASERFAAHP